MAKKKTPQDDMRELVKFLKDRAEHWKYLRDHGGQDPFYSDGCNMQLTRNHIIGCKRQIKELAEETGQDLPEEYSGIETPPEVGINYMANPDQIRADARAALKRYRENEDYIFLRDHMHDLTEQELKETYIPQVLGYISRLEEDINADNLIAMRRGGQYGRYEEAFTEKRRKYEEIIAKREEPDERPMPQGQLSIFDLALV